MYHSCVDRYSLFKSRKYGSHVLSTFDLAPARDIVCSSVAFLSTPKSSITSSAHLQWCMECIGHAFCLSMQDADVIRQAIDLYETWLFTASPQPFAADRDYYEQTVVCHLSLLFEHRYQNVASLEKHAELCKVVLGVFSRLVHRGCSSKTWKVLLKVQLAVCMSILEGPAVGNTLGNVLESLALGVLFDSWLTWGGRDPELWGLLHSFTRIWLHRKRLFEELHRVRRALTRKLGKLGEECSKIKIEIQWAGKWRFSSTVSDEQLVYWWNQFFHLAGQPELINDPEILCLATKGIVELHDSCWTDGSSKNGECILRVFGSWMFGVASNQTSGFEQARSLALHALGRIYCHCPAEQFSFRQTAEFFHILSKTLSTSPTDSVLVSSVLSSCTDLFTTRLPARYALVPDFMPHIRKALSSSSSFKELVRPSLLILGSLICLGNNFRVFSRHSNGSSDVSRDGSGDGASHSDGSGDGSTHGIGSTCVSMARIHHHLLSIPSLLLNVVSSDTTDSSNLRLSFQLLELALHEDAQQTCAFSRVLTRTLWYSLEKRQWSKSDSVCALTLLSRLSRLYVASDPEHVSAALDLVRPFAEYISGYFQGRNRKMSSRKLNTRTELSHLAVAALLSLCRILESIPWVLRDKSLCEKVISSVLMAAEMQSSPEEERACEELLSFLLRQLGSDQDSFLHSNSVLDQFSQPSESVFVNVLAEIGFLLTPSPSKLRGLDNSMKTSVIRHFQLGPRSILSVVQFPPKKSFAGRNGTGSVFLLVRNESGKFLWEANPVYTDNSYQVEVEPETRDKSAQKSPRAAARLETLAQVQTEIPVFDLMSDEISISEYNSAEETLCSTRSREIFHQWNRSQHSESIQHLSQSCAQLLKDTKEFHDDLTKTLPKYSAIHTLKAPSFEPSTENSFNYRFREARLLFSQMGLLQTSEHNGKPKLKMLVPGKDLDFALKELDSCPSHDVFTIAILHQAKDTAADLSEIVRKSTSSKPFENFVHSLASFVPMTECKGFKGGLLEEDAHFLPYHIDSRVEIFFHIPSMLSEHAPKQELVDSNLVRVIWSEEPPSKHLSKNCLLLPHLEKKLGHSVSSISGTSLPVVYIFVVPLGNRMYLIKIDDSSLFRRLKKQKPGGDTFQNSIPLRSRIWRSARGKTTDVKDIIQEDNDDAAEMIGPLSSNCVVREALLGRLVRETCTNYMTFIMSQFQSDGANPKVVRSKLISSIAFRQVADLDSSLLANTLFQSQLPLSLRRKRREQ